MHRDCMIFSKGNLQASGQEAPLLARISSVAAFTFIRSQRETDEPVCEALQLIYGNETITSNKQLSETLYTQ
jgi:hypothetical protein